MKIKSFRGLVTRVGYVFILLCLLVSNVGPVQTVQAAPGDTIRVSVASDSTQGNSDSSYETNSSGFGNFISDNGSLIVFRSFATNLVSGDTNGYNDIFLRNESTHETQRISLGVANTQANNSRLSHTATIAEAKERKKSILDVSMSHITARNGSDALAVECKRCTVGSHIIVLEPNSRGNRIHMIGENDYEIQKDRNLCGTRQFTDLANKSFCKI